MLAALLIGLGIGILAILVVIASPQTYYEERTRRLEYDPSTGRVTATERHVRSGPVAPKPDKPEFEIIEAGPRPRALTYDERGQEDIIDAEWEDASTLPVHVIA